MDTVEITKKEIVDLDTIKNSIQGLKDEIAYQEGLGEKGWAKEHYNAIIQPMKNRLAEREKYLQTINLLKK
jgi:endonuclease/exonuclease/phosphatase family metal-dependent hydrolase